MEGLKITGITLTPEACFYILTSACGSSGIVYWAKGRQIRHTKKGLVRSVQIMDMEGADEGEEPKRYTIGAAEIRKAVERMLVDPDSTDSVGWAARLVIEDGADGPLSDAIVQVACFGKVLYG